MASSAVLLLQPPNLSNSLSLSSRTPPPLFSLFKTNTTFSSSAAASKSLSRRPPLVVTVSAALQALIFDCDGVILESEHLHRQAYNDAFEHFNVRCPSSSSSHPLNWTPEFYDVFQNLVGGGKPKMRWYFKENGWPTSTVFDYSPETDEEREKLIDILQVSILFELDKLGRKLAVCSAATKSSVIMCLENLIGMERFQSLDCFLAGDDVKQKKPDPSIYVTAAEKLGVSEKDCMVVEDSVIGLQAATGAGMPCVISYTSSTADQDFKEAAAIYPDLSNVRLTDLEALLKNEVPAN
ncbi:PREDICTED: haloacid dehalogenase-like hydrolase domain-containing protein At4g39970 [Erythranthe guttata]|nr:PREDICTED: haloacid dehalogenase-like hydrolase domain-containing protein At4g39970 [Erythranthe guttata]|eukprot:XP_012844916.1 PREDICTED: haloacid dehalogenase-like hydrolase domain-containing protein At4g39970 [Erythranthe guttata]